MLVLGLVSIHVIIGFGFCLLLHLIDNLLLAAVHFCYLQQPKQYAIVHTSDVSMVAWVGREPGQVGQVVMS